MKTLILGIWFLLLVTACGFALAGAARESAALKNTALVFVTLAFLPFVFIVMLLCSCVKQNGYRYGRHRGGKL